MTDSTIELIRAIVEIGILPCFCAMVLILIWIWTNKMMKRLDKQEARIDDKLKRQHVYTEVEEQHSQKVGDAINKKLSLLREECNANRTSYYMFHNGEFMNNGRSFKKLSLVQESVDDKTVPIMSQLQNIPRQTYPVIIEKLYGTGECFLDSIDSLKQDDNVSYYHLHERGTKCFYARAVKDPYSKVDLGFVCVEYSIDNPIDFKKLKILIYKAADFISGVIEMKSEEENLLDGNE